MATILGGVYHVAITSINTSLPLGPRCGGNLWMSYQSAVAMQIDEHKKTEKVGMLNAEPYAR